MGFSTSDATELKRCDSPRDFSNDPEQVGGEIGGQVEHLRNE